VVTVTSRTVGAAFAVIVTLTVMLLTLAVSGAVAVTPAPLNVTTDELVKFVELPVIVSG